VKSLSEDVYYGNLVLEVNGDQRYIDCRPSDALALAARMRVPIMVSSDVMDQAGITPEEDLTADEIKAYEAELEEPNLDIFENFLKGYDEGDSNPKSDAEDEV